MQAKKTLVLGLLALAAVPLSAEDRGNCRDWNTMSDARQIGFIQGFINGLAVGAFDAANLQGLRDGLPFPTSTLASTDATAKDVETSYVGPSTFGEMQEGITAICKRPENSSIGISDALRAFTMKLRGKPQSEIDDHLNMARQGVIAHPDSDGTE